MNASESTIMPLPLGMGSVKLPKIRFPFAISYTRALPLFIGGVFFTSALLLSFYFLLILLFLLCAVKPLYYIGLSYLCVIKYYTVTF